MRNLWILTRILLKNNLGASVTVNKKGGKMWRKIIFAILIALAFVPMIGGFAEIVSKSYDILVKVHQEGIVLGLGLSAVSFTIFFFGIFYILNVFYFAKDIENLLPLPLRPYEILGAKLIVTVIYEYLTELLFLLPVVITYGVKSKSGIGYYFYAGIVFFALPLIPLIFSALIDMLVMRFTNIAKNKDKFRIVAGVIALLVALGFNTLLQRFGSATSDPAKLQQLILEGNNSLLTSSGKIFPAAKFAALSLINSSNFRGFLFLFALLLSTVVAVVIFLFIAEKLYFRGVSGVSESSSTRKKLTTEQFSKSTLQRSRLMAYTLKELRILFRTPVYFLNCVLFNFLFPVFLLVPFLFNPELLKNITRLKALLHNDASAGLLLAGGFIVSIFLTTTNAITSTAISREGRNLFVSKYLPLSYKKQLMAKVLSGFMLGTVAVVMFMIVAVILVKPPLEFLLLFFVLSIIGNLFSCLSGMLIDLYFPKLSWDTEQKAVKQNFNVFLHMLLCTVAAGVIGYFVYIMQFTLVNTFAVISVIFILIDIVLYVFLMRAGVKVFSRIEI